MIQDYKIKARNGEQFEQELLGENSNIALNVGTTQSNFSDLIKQVISSGNGECPAIPKTRRLFDQVQSYLRGLGVKEKLFFYSSINTPLDFNFGVDFFFYVKVGKRNFVVTVDLYYVSSGNILQILERFYPDERLAARGDDLSLKKIIADDYPKFQNFFDWFKHSIKKELKYDLSNWRREENHFFLTPLDMEGGKCFRAFAKGVANSFHRQITARDAESNNIDHNIAV